MKTFLFANARRILLSKREMSISNSVLSGVKSRAEGEKGA